VEVPVNLVVLKHSHDVVAVVLVERSVRPGVVGGLPVLCFLKVAELRICVEESVVAWSSAEVEDLETLAGAPKR
jgi:hypothetical protein